MVKLLAEKGADLFLRKTSEDERRWTSRSASGGGRAAAAAARKVGVPPPVDGPDRRVSGDAVESSEFRQRAIAGNRNPNS